MLAVLLLLLVVVFFENALPEAGRFRVFALRHFLPLLLFSFAEMGAIFANTHTHTWKPLNLIHHTHPLRHYLKFRTHTHI